MRPEPRGDRPFVDTPVTDVAAATELARRSADRWGVTVVTAGRRVGMNAVFMAGDVVVRVGAVNAAAEAAFDLAGRLADASVRVPRPAGVEPVVVGTLTATLWERVVPDGSPVDWEEVGRMVARLHTLGSDAVPPRYPCPSPTTFPWWDFDALLADLAGEIDAQALAGLAAAVERHRWWRDGARERAARALCHGDVHPDNVVQTADGPVLLDWDLLCVAPPGWDHAPMLTWAERWGGAPGEYEAFVAGYGRSYRDDPFAIAVAELRLVAATLMRVRAGRSDPAARAEADRRLAFWRGDHDAPAWCAQ